MGNVTYGDIYEDFKRNNPDKIHQVADYRPCEPPYFHKAVPMTIIIWLKEIVNYKPVARFYRYKEGFVAE